MNSDHSPSPAVARVLLIGLGGTSYDVLVPLAEAGIMPNLARMMQSAALVRLRTGSLHGASVAWATLQSGGGPGVHGVLDNRYLDHRRHWILPADARPLRCPTLAEGINAIDPRAPAVQLADPSDVSPIWEGKPSDFAGLARGIARTQALLRGLVASADRVDRSTDWRLLEVRFSVLDSLLHRLWHLLGIGRRPGGNRRWIAKTREAFRTLDDCLGALAELAERRGAAVLLVSPFGFGPFRDKITLSELLRRRGLLHVAGGRSRAGYRLLRLAWKARRHLPVLRRERKEPAGAMLPIDWRRSPAVTLHGQTAALVYLNTPERFGTRVLTTPRAVQQAAADVMAALCEARHPVSHQPLFPEVFLTRERFGLDPLASGWPEVIALPAPGFHTRHRLDRNRQLVRPDPSLAATHTGDGLLMVRAPGVVTGRPYVADLADVAPTILHMLGLSRGAAMTGRAVRQLFVRPSPAARRGPLQV